MHRKAKNAEEIGEKVAKREERIRGVWRREERAAAGKAERKIGGEKSLEAAGGREAEEGNTVEETGAREGVRLEKEKLHAILIQEWVSQLEADLINAHYARSRWNDTVLFEFLRDFSRRRL